MSEETVQATRRQGFPRDAQAHTAPPLPQQAEPLSVGVAKRGGWSAGIQRVGAIVLVMLHIPFVMVLLHGPVEEGIHVLGLMLSAVISGGFACIVCGVLRLGMWIDRKRGQRVDWILGRTCRVLFMTDILLMLSVVTFVWAELFWFRDGGRR